MKHISSMRQQITQGAMALSVQKTLEKTQAHLLHNITDDPQRDHFLSYMYHKTPAQQQVELLCKNILGQDYKYDQSINWDLVIQQIREKKMHMFSFPSHLHYTQESIIHDKLKSIPNYTITTLDTINYEQEKYLVQALHHIDGKVVYERFGAYMLLRARLRDRKSAYDSTRVSESIKKYTHYNLVMLDKARDTMRQFCHDHSMTRIIQNYNLFTTLEQHIQKRNIAEILQKHYKGERKDMLQQYSVQVDTPMTRLKQGRSTKRGFPEINPHTRQCFLRHDAPIVLALMYDNNPIAVIGMYIDASNNLYINQLQAVSYGIYENQRQQKLKDPKVHRSLHRIHRQDALYQMATQIARDYHCQGIVLQSGVNNKRVYQDYDDGQTHFPLEKAEKIYDTFAIKQGFFLNPKDNNRYQKID